MEEKAIDYNEIRDYYNAIAEECGLPKCLKITKERRAAVRARIQEYGQRAVFDAMDNLRGNAFFAGDNNRGWKANFDFVFAPTRFIKLYERAYDRGRKLSNLEKAMIDDRQGASAALSVATDSLLSDDREPAGEHNQSPAWSIDNLTDRD